MRSDGFAISMQLLGGPIPDAGKVPGGPSATASYQREIDVTNIPASVLTGIGATHSCLMNGTNGDGTILKNLIQYVLNSSIWDSIIVPTGTLLLTKTDGTAETHVFDVSGHKGWINVRGAGMIRTQMNQPNRLGPDLTQDIGGRYPTVQMGNIGGSVGQGGIIWSDFSLIGPVVSTDASDGEMRDRGAGFLCEQKHQLYRVSTQGWHSGFLYPQNCDHGLNFQTESKANWYGMYRYGSYNVSNGNTADGDDCIFQPLWTNNAFAVYACDPAGIIFDSEIYSGHGGTCAVGYYRESGPKGPKTLPAGARVTRDTDGTVHLDTNQDATQSSWFGWKIPPAFGFHVGDWIEFANTVFGSSINMGGSSGKQMGQVTAIETHAGGINNAMLRITMDVPVTGSVQTNLTATGTMSHHYNQQRWIDDNFITGQTLEGVGRAFFFCQDGDSFISQWRGDLVMHGVEVPGSNGGVPHILGPVALTYATRADPVVFPTWDPAGFGPPIVQEDGTGGTFDPTTDNYSLCTLYMPGATAVQSGIQLIRPGDAIFADTGSGLITSGQAAANNGSTLNPNNNDDSIPHSNWKGDTLRMRGRYIVYSVSDDGNPAHDQGCVIQYLQLYSASKHPYAARTVGTAHTLGSAGYIDKLVGMRAGALTGCVGVFDIGTNDKSGPAPVEFMYEVGSIADNNIKIDCNPPTCPKFLMPPQLPTDGSPINTNIPANTRIIVGDQEFSITHSASATAQGHILEMVNRDDVQLAGTSGNMIMGMSAWTTKAIDFVAVMRKGNTRAAVTYGGFLSKTSFPPGTKLAADLLNPGMAKALLLPGETFIGQTTVGSKDVSGIFGSPSATVFRTHGRVEVANASPTGIAAFAQALIPTSTTKTTNYTAVPGDFVPADTTSGTWVLTLPNAPPDGTRIGAKLIIQGPSATPLTIVTHKDAAAAGGVVGVDVFNKPGGGTSMTIADLNQGMQFQYQASRQIWFVMASDHARNVLRTPREVTIDTATTWAIDASVTDIFTVTGQAANVTTISNPSGATPVQGQLLLIRVKDNGTGHTLNFSGGQWRASSDLAFPTTTIANKTLYMWFIFNKTDTKWDLYRVLNNFS